MKAKEFDIKKRNPNWRTMQDIRRSGAGGQHKDKKRAAKQGEVKHKSQVAESEHLELYGLRIGDTVTAKIDGGRVQGDIIDIYPEDMEVELFLRGPETGRTVVVDVRDTEIVEATGDEKFDTMMRRIKKDTKKQATADRRERDTESRRRSRDAFGPSPADKLSIRPDKDVEEGLTTEKQILTRIRQIMHDRKLSRTESNAGELHRLKQQLKDLRSQQSVAESDEPDEQYLDKVISDLHKDALGMRPDREFGREWMSSSYEEKLKIYNNMLKNLHSDLDEATGDEKFDTIMRTIKKGTKKQATADRREREADSRQKARDAFGPSPADKLSIRSNKDVAEGLTTEKQILTRVRQIMYDRKLSGTESNAGELLRLKQQLKDMRSQQSVAEAETNWSSGKGGGNNFFRDVSGMQNQRSAIKMIKDGMRGMYGDEIAGKLLRGYDDWAAHIGSDDINDVAKAMLPGIKKAWPTRNKRTITDIGKKSYSPPKERDRVYWDGDEDVAEGSDWGEPREILEDVLQTLEREVEWPLTEVMDPKEVRQLLSPLVRAVNDKLLSMDRDGNQ